jgi:Fic family protein
VVRGSIVDYNRGSIVDYNLHEVLLSGTRGAEKLPGEFRRSQNRIGGTRPGNALFVPPPVEYLNQCLSSFESFLHNNTLPVLINAGIAHVQFETIHPFRR